MSWNYIHSYLQNRTRNGFKKERFESFLNVWREQGITVGLA